MGRAYAGIYRRIILPMNHQSAQKILYQIRNSKFKAFYIYLICERARRREFLFNELAVGLTLVGLVFMWVFSDAMFYWTLVVATAQTLFLFRFLVPGFRRLNDLNDLYVFYEVQHTDYRFAYEILEQGDPFKDLEGKLNEIVTKEQIRFERLADMKVPVSNNLIEKARMLNDIYFSSGNQSNGFVEINDEFITSSAVVNLN